LKKNIYKMPLKNQTPENHIIPARTVLFSLTTEEWFSGVTGRVYINDTDLPDDSAPTRE